MFNGEHFQRIYIFIAQTMVCLHFVLLFELMDNFNIFVSKAKDPPSFSCYKCLTCYFVAKSYFKIQRGAVPPCRAHFVQGEKCSTQAVFTIICAFITGLDEESFQQKHRYSITAKKFEN